MKINDLVASLDYMFKAQVTPFIWGHAGLGKSTVLKQYAKEKGYKFFPFYLGTMSDTGDILGLATFVKDKHGNDIATKFAEPKWLKEMIDYCEANPDSGAVILLDEFNRARRDILNGMFSLALDKTFHTIKLPANCHIVAAGNPPTDEYYVTDVNETALMARFVHIKLEPTFEEWVTYAKANDFEHTFIGFLQEQPELIEDKKSDFPLPIKVDRRSWERANRLVKLGTPQPLLDQLLTGIIGAERLVAYKMYLQSTDKPMTGEDVLTGKAYKKVEKWSDPLNIKSSLLSLTCDNVLATLENMEKDKEALKDTEEKNLFEFLEVLPKDIFYPLAQKLTHKQLKVFRDFSNKSKYQKKLIKLVHEARGETKK